MADTKAEWRERLLCMRRAVDTETRRQASVEVVLRLAQLGGLARARSVLLYVACGAEVDVGALERRAARAGKAVYRPAGTVPPPAWIPVGPTRSSGQSPTCATTRHSGREAPPSGVAAEQLAFPVLVIAPGVAFDEYGRRLGRGSGYYDRALGALRRAGDVVVVGVAYDLQVVHALPQDPWDQRVDLIVTERRLVVPNPMPHPDVSAPCAGGGTR